MRVLVAGGRGFIGARAVSALATAGHDAGVLEHDDVVATVCAAGWDALVWCAGARRATALENRVEHVDAPLAALALLPRATRVVYLSSGETYGAQDVPFVEDAPLLGTSPYALAKIEGERALSAACAARSVSLSILRPSVVYGPGQRGAMFVPSLVHALTHGERFAMTAGEQTRDLVHVDDVARAIALALTGPAGTYNISSGTEITMRALATELATRTSTTHLLDIGALPYRPNEQMRYLLSPARAAASLGWTARRGVTLLGHNIATSQAF
ncbi:MAG TPA: NAD(P)-dependent oxidoreductase [Kofleriaceae bacterium]|nr:NAD(P)-dependent oxidoreductase [Kofleriaceae bacterium]